MKMAHMASERSTCISRHVGAIIVKDNQVLATGYNGPPSNLKHCSEIGGCYRKKMKIKSGERMDICRAAHAEANAITQAAKHGVRINGAKIYCTTFPCAFCLKLIINAGIEEIIFEEPYDDALSKEMIGESKIKVRQFRLNK